MMRFSGELQTAAVRYQLAPQLVQAIVEQESSGLWYARRYEPNFWNVYLKDNPLWKTRDPQEVASSYGLMQILFVVAVEDGFTGNAWDLFVPSINLDAGCKHFRKQLDWASAAALKTSAKGKDTVIMQSALAAYNGGKSGNLPDNLPDRNRAYAISVWDRYQRLLSQK